MRLKEAVKLGREMLRRDDCHCDTFYQVFSPDYRKALERLVREGDGRMAGWARKHDSRRTK
ncbi:MAG: hypothetical protein KGI84_08845 [Elusimicrobia bacterium]|nr:hypothetical protein [Elusimicrobiota bacterium]